MSSVGSTDSTEDKNVSFANPGKVRQKLNPDATKSKKRRVRRMKLTREQGLYANGHKDGYLHAVAEANTDIEARNTRPVFQSARHTIEILARGQHHCAHSHQIPRHFV